MTRRTAFVRARRHQFLLRVLNGMERRAAWRYATLIAEVYAKGFPQA